MTNHVNYDYQSLVDKMTTILENKDGWGDAYQSSMGQTLIQLMADVTDHLHYMLERRTIESYVTLARLRSSVVARASDLGYRPLRVRGHSGFLELKIVDDEGNPRPVVGEVSIPAMTQVSYDGRNFFLVEPAFIPTGESSATVRVKEGVMRTDVFNIDDADIIFSNYSNIEEDIFFVHNNGEEYLDVRKASNVNKRALSFLQADDAYYDIKYGVDGMRVVFGDNDYGKRPVGDVSIYYSVVDNVGEAIHSLGNEFTLAEPLVDFQHNSVEYKYTLTNSSPIVGGAPEESIESIRKNATAYHRSNGRAVTNEDYEFWMSTAGIADIVDVRCFGEEEFDSLIYNLNNVYLTYATSTGSELTADQIREYLEFLSHVKTTQAHPVFIPARNIGLRLDLDVVKHKNVPISNAQAYSILYNFAMNYLAIKEGSIGKGFQVSDMIDAMYDLTYVRNGITYRLVDYVKISADGAISFTLPTKTNEAFITLDSEYVPNNGDEFILNLDNVACKTVIQQGQTIFDVLTAMRDVIRGTTPFKAFVEVYGVSLDDSGNPVAVEVNPRFGYHLLVGADTPYFSPTDILQPAVVGSTLVDVAAWSNGFLARQFYYSTPAGRRPMIPLRMGTRVVFTAPGDTAVRMYIRTNALDAGTEELRTTIQPGAMYEFTSEEEHAVIFEYVNDSSEDAIAYTYYPDFSSATYGIRIATADDFGTFEVRKTGGDLEDMVRIDYHFKLPAADFATVGMDQLVMPGSVRITNHLGNVVYHDNGNGVFLDFSGRKADGGSVDYVRGVVVLPQMEGMTGEYYILFDQDRFENLTIGSSDVIKLIPPPPTSDSTAISLSTLKVS